MKDPRVPMLVLSLIAAACVLGLVANFLANGHGQATPVTVLLAFFAGLAEGASLCMAVLRSQGRRVKETIGNG